MPLTHQEQFAAKLNTSFGPLYTTVITLAARMRRAAAASADDLNPLDTQAVAEHLAYLHHIEGVRLAAQEILRDTEKIKGPALAHRLPGAHIQTMLDAMHTDRTEQYTP